MINTLLTHKIRKELIRQNKKHNHREYLQALDTFPRVRYWAGYHKKKLIFLGLVALISWNYDLHTSFWHSLISLRSPQQFLKHFLFDEEKMEKTVNQQRIVGWTHGDDTLNVLTRLFYETDKRLIFGVGRNYLFQVYSSMGLLQKPEDIRTFWIGGGFHKRRNQLVSGVSYKEFMNLYCEGFKSLIKTNPSLSQQEYLKAFLQLFVEKAPEIINWQKDFNKKRYQQYLKNLVSDHEKKTDEINNLMRQNLQITEQQMEQQLSKIGMKGLGLQDKWVFWKNREILLSLREYTLHNRLNLNIVQGKERIDLEKRLSQVQRELTLITKKKEDIKSQFKAVYQEDLI